jgi:MFS family permease
MTLFETKRANWLIISVLGLGQMVAFASSFYLLGVLAEPISHDLDMPATCLFAAMTGSYIISAIIIPRAGRWIDARGGRSVLLVSNIAFALALLILGTAQSPTWAGAGLLTLGVGMGLGLYSTPFAILVQLYGDKARQSITAVSLLGAAGGAAGWPISYFLLTAFDWRSVCFSWAAAHVFLCLPFTLLVVPALKNAHKKSGVAAANKIRWDRPMIQLAVLFACVWTVSTAMSAHMPRLLLRFGLDNVTAVSMASFMGLSAVGARLILLITDAKLPPIASVRIATLLHPIGAVVILMLGSAAAFVFPIAQGAGNGLLSVATGVLPLVIFGKENFASRNGLILMPATFVQSIGPWIYGLALAQSPTMALTLSSSLCITAFAMTFGLVPKATQA